MKSLATALILITVTMPFTSHAERLQNRQVLSEATVKGPVAKAMFLAINLESLKAQSGLADADTSAQVYISGQFFVAKTTSIECRTPVRSGIDGNYELIDKSEFVCSVSK